MQSYILYLLPFEANKNGGVNYCVRGQLGEAEFSKMCRGLGAWPQVFQL